MRTTKLFLLAAVSLMLVSGCKTTETAKPVSWRQQSAYLSKVCDPRLYGLGIYQTPAGVEYRGGGRLHPNQSEALDMLAKEPLRPVVKLRANFGVEWPVLLDVTSSSSWLGFGPARKLGAQPVGEREARLVKLPGEDILNALSVVQALRLGLLHIERPLIYVRMANGSFGKLARGIESPKIEGVIGWDLLEKFEQIQFCYSEGKVLLFTDKEYQPDPSQVVAQVPLVRHAGACAVRGMVDGEMRLVLIDPAGDFEVATDNAASVSKITLGKGIGFTNPQVADSPGGIRIGARLLQKYNVVICPQKNQISFERR